LWSADRLIHQVRGLKMIREKIHFAEICSKPRADQFWSIWKRGVDSE
jgi:hypothetical protein